MISFLLCLALLIVGYFVYGKIVDNTFGPDDRETPAVRINDGVDYVVMPQWKLFLVQLLNIAGLGPIFGALQGALWGPVVFLWITFGTIFAGGVHDYFSGMMSERNDGASIAEVTGRYLGPVMQNIMRVFSVVLLIMVGTVFAVGPAGLIVTLCKNSGMSGVLTTTLFWLIIILVYYFIATFISIDAIIGKIYPVFGICLIIMAVGVIFGIFTNPAYTIPEIWANFSNMHPSNTPIWSFMFITVACGAISGFHSTQSPLMARCMKSEKQGHFVFYGAMVSEGIIALIWAAAGCALYTITDGKMVGLAEALAAGQSAAIYDVCLKTMGNVGVALAMIGVVICPITSGDTAFRSARLTLADWLKIDQDSYANRLKLCIPVLGVGAFLGIGNALGFINYTVIWRYFSWTNQTLAMIVLWAASMYLFKVAQKKDTIMNNKKAAANTVKIELISASRTGVRVKLVFNTTKQTDSPLTMYAKVSSSDRKDIVLDTQIPQETAYYVYGQGGLNGIYTDPAKAVLRADTLGGVVLNRTQQYVWERGNKKTKMQIDTEGIPEIVLQGTYDIKTLKKSLKKTGTVIDLSGCSLDSVLYEISAQRPVIAKTGADTSVVIVGYDEYNTWLYDPVKKETYPYGMNDSTDLFQKAGNVFITYIETVNY